MLRIKGQSNTLLKKKRKKEGCLPDVR